MECGLGPGVEAADWLILDAAVPLPPTTAGPIDGPGLVFGPRHLPFELHLPNAPPLAI